MCQPRNETSLEPPTAALVRIGLSAALLLAASLLVVALPAAADDVYLVNGQIFENVVVEYGESSGGSGTVVLRLEFGALTLPASHVERVEVAVSPLSELLRREEMLRSSPAVEAARWLELSEWARRQGLDEGARRAALMAARLEPELPALSVPLTRLGYRFDSQGVEWVSHDEAMRRQGLVERSGQWITVEEARARAEQNARQRNGERRARAEAEPVAAPAREDSDLADVALAQVDLLRDIMGKEVGSGVVGGFAFGTYGVPALPLSGSFPVGPTRGRSISTSAQEAWDILSVRQPGSILPMQSYRQP
jgi:hypothetical protein